MEVENLVSKNLHKHVLPIIIVLGGFMILSIAGFNYYSKPVANSVLRQALVAHFVLISPSRNGLAKLSINRPASTSNQTPQPSLGARGTTVGGTAQLNLSVE
jgi:hypothetical protein